MWLISLSPSLRPVFTSQEGDRHTDGLSFSPSQIVGIGEDFHSQVDDGKAKTTLYKVRWQGYDRKDDTLESITRIYRDMLSW